jgi:hypothetical protein
MINGKICGNNEITREDGQTQKDQAEKENEKMTREAA